jgi:hypothetical protein
VEVRGYLKEGNNGKEMASGAYFMEFFSSGGSFVFAIALWLRCCCFVKILYHLDVFVAPPKWRANPGLANQIS